MRNLLVLVRPPLRIKNIFCFDRCFAVLLRIGLVLFGLLSPIVLLELVTSQLLQWNPWLYPLPKTGQPQLYDPLPTFDHYELPTTFRRQPNTRAKTPRPEPDGVQVLDYSEQFVSSTLGTDPSRHLFAGEFYGYRSIMRTTPSRELIYNVEITLDKFKHRTTPQQTPLPGQKFAFFFGGSRVYGEGSNDAETIPAQFANIASGYTVYNFGSPGNSINDYVADLRERKGMLWQNVVERQGAAFLFIFFDDLNRVLGSLSHAMHFFLQRPYFYRSPTGELKNCATFQSCRPWRSKVYLWLNQSSTLRFFHINLPLRFTSEDYDFVADLIAEFRQQFHETFPRAKFYVVFFPEIAKQSLLLREPLARRGISYFDYGAWVLSRESEQLMFLPYDSHFTPAANALIGQKLAGDLLLKNLIYSNLEI